MSDDDFFITAQTKLRTTLADAFKEISALKTRNSSLQAENSELKFRNKDLCEELKDTQAALGRAVVNANRRQESGDARVVLEAPEERSSVNTIRTESAQLATPQPSSSSLKRPRAPSFETLASPKKKAKDASVIQPNSPSAEPVHTRRVTSVYVNVPQLKTPSTHYRHLPKQQPRPNPNIQDYLTSCIPLEITPPALPLQVPRKFLRCAYGGSEHQFLQYIPEDMNPSGPSKRRLVFPMLEFHPFMPTRPGLPGLLYTPRHEILSDGPWTLFGKLTNSPFWDYLGEYENEICGKLTAAQFANLPMKLRRTWSQTLVRTKTFQFCNIIRARIALRKEGIIPLSPTNPDAEDTLIQNEVKAIRKGTGKIITEDDILTAFSKGNEVVDIIRMTCVKYDHVFANDIEAKLPNLDTLLAATSQKKAAASLGNQPPPPPTSVARLTPDVESEDEEQAQEHEQEQEQEPEQEQSKDSKSGPTSENSEPPPPNLSPRRPRVASQEVLKRIGEGLIQDFGVEDSLDLDYVEEESQ